MQVTILPISTNCCRDLEITSLKIYLKKTFNRQKKKFVISDFFDDKVVFDSNS